VSAWLDASPLFSYLAAGAEFRFFPIVLRSSFQGSPPVLGPTVSCPARAFYSLQFSSFPATLDRLTDVSDLL